MRRRSVEEVEKEDIKEIKEDIYNSGTVNCAFLNVRKEPKPDSKLVKIIKKGDRVTIDTTFEDKLWFKIEDGYTKKAFIDVD